MSKPEDIPQGVWDRVIDEIAGPGVHVHSNSYRMVVERIARAILSAVEEEREACAALADKGHWEHRPGLTMTSPASAVYVGKIGPEIAKDIRNRKGA